MRVQRKLVLVVATTVVLGCFFTIGVVYMQLTEELNAIDQKHSSTLHKLAAPLTAQEEKLLQFIDELTLNRRCTLNSTYTPWQLAESCLRPRSISNCDKKILECALDAMRTYKINHADGAPRGTQLKLALTVQPSQRLIFKPKVYNDDYSMVGTPYAGRDRHYAEIAAFHISRILGLYNVPLTTIHELDLESDIRPVGHQNLLKTFFYKDGNTCFNGNCHYCKGPEYGVCGEGTSISGSVSLWLPDSYTLAKPLPHPWRRTYREGKIPEWERNPASYCQAVKEIRPYEEAPRLLDLISISVMDFLISNADRHHYETFEYSRDSIVVALDNGKSFGNPYIDELSILAPLTQCCTIRDTLYERLTDLRGILGTVLYHVLKSEPHPFKFPNPHHYKALDRRLDTVLQNIENCIHEKGRDHVIVTDNF